MAESINWTPTRNEKVAQGLTSAVVCQARQEATKRTTFIIRNVSSADADVITLGLGFRSVVAENGIVLKKGEHYSESTDNGFQCWQGEISAICATANGQLSIFER
jgi:hypothetical protein